MCEICRQVPCHPRCPNAPEPVPVYECTECHEGIFDDEKYFDGPNGPICSNCIDDMSASEMMELLGEEMSHARAS